MSDDAKPIINIVNVPPPNLPSMSAYEIAVHMLYMNCRRCGVTMERGKQCPRCGAWCR